MERTESAEHRGDGAGKSVLCCLDGGTDCFESVRCKESGPSSAQGGDSSCRTGTAEAGGDAGGGSDARGLCGQVSRAVDGRAEAAGGGRRVVSRRRLSLC